MAVIFTNGQSFDEIAALFTLSPAYGPGIAAHNNYEGQDISTGKFYVEIPDNWMKPEYAGKQITLPKKQNAAGESGGMSTTTIVAIAAGLALLLLK